MSNMFGGGGGGTMGVDPTTDTTDSVRTSSWTCSYTLRVKQPVTDRLVRTSFIPVPTSMGRGTGDARRPQGRIKDFYQGRAPSDGLVLDSLPLFELHIEILLADVTKPEKLNILTLTWPMTSLVTTR